jgi:hypothetical protein
MGQPSRKTGHTRSHFSIRLIRHSLPLVALAALISGCSDPISPEPHNLHSTVDRTIASPLDPPWWYGAGGKGEVYLWSNSGPCSGTTCENQFAQAYAQTETNLTEDVDHVTAQLTLDLQGTGCYPYPAVISDSDPTLARAELTLGCSGGIRAGSAAGLHKIYWISGYIETGETYMDL